MTFQIKAETQAELTAKTVIAETIMAISLEQYTPEIIEAAQLAEALIDMSEDAITWHNVIDERNVGDVSIEYNLRELVTHGTDNVHPEARGVGIAFGELMLRIAEEDRETVLDIAEGIAPRVCLRTASEHLYGALKAAGVLNAP